MATAYAHLSNQEKSVYVRPGLKRISDWIKFKHPDPSGIRAGYDLKGNAIANWGAKCFTSSLVSSCIVKDSGNVNEEYMKKGWNYIKRPSSEKNEDGEYVDYFNDTVTLLNMPLMSGNWWNPN